MRFADFVYTLGVVWNWIPKVIPTKKIKQLFMSGFYGATFASCGKRFRIVTQSFPAHSVIAGCPAKLIKVIEA